MEDNDEKQAVEKRCLSCGGKVKHKYCPKCGEKVILPERDLSLRKFVGQSMWHLVHFDSKLLRSIWLVFSKPGFMTTEWTAGRRVNYMKPLQLFALAALLFYFFLSAVPVYYCTPEDLKLGFEHHIPLINTFGFDIQSAIAQKAVELKMDETTLKTAIVKASSLHSKSFLFAVIPFWGMLIFLFFKKQMPWLAPHLVLALEGMTFYMFSDLMLHAILDNINLSRQIKIVILPSLLLGLMAFLLLAIRRIYGISWGLALFKTLAILIGFTGVILLYRQIITISTVWLF